MEALRAADGGPTSTLLFEYLESKQPQGCTWEDAPAGWRPPTARRRPPRPLVQVAVWLVMLYLLPQAPRAEARNSTGALVGVPPSPNVGLDKVLGRWYVVKDMQPRSIFHYPVYDWIDIWRDENDTLTAQWFKKSVGGYVLRPPEPIIEDVPEFDDEEGFEDRPALRYNVVGLSPDERRLSLAVCARCAANCTVLPLTRHAALADDSDGLEGARPPHVVLVGLPLSCAC